MLPESDSLAKHRAQATHPAAVNTGRVVFSPIKSAWVLGMSASAFIGGTMTFTWPAVLLFAASTVLVLLFGHSLGNHRKLVHDSFQCPKWLEYTLVYCGAQVGIAGPIGLLKQHDLRDFAQRLPTCHPYLRHGTSAIVDAWWQTNCELQLAEPPAIALESAIANDRFYRFLERTWMAQHLPWAMAFWLWGGWSFVFWGVCARVSACIFGHWAIGFLAHNHGDVLREVRGAAVQGRNVRWVSLLTMGESWHNNHHAFPGSARLGLNAGEWDPGWWVLSALQQVGLVWGVKLPDDLPYRQELKLVTTLDGEVMHGHAS